MRPFHSSPQNLNDSEADSGTHISHVKLFISITKLPSLRLTRQAINYNVTSRSVRANVVAVEKYYVLHISKVCVCSLKIPSVKCACAILLSVALLYFSTSFH